MTLRTSSSTTLKLPVFRNSQRGVSQGQETKRKKENVTVFQFLLDFRVIWDGDAFPEIFKL